MIRMYPITAVSRLSYRTAIGVVVMAGLVSSGCTTNYLTNSTEGTYGVPVTERTIPQRLLDRSIEHTSKINIYGLQENLQQNSRMGIDSFNSEVLLTGEVPTDLLKAEIEKVVSSMPDVRRVYNELDAGVARGYSSTVQDGYITSKLLAKIAANNSVKASQLKAITNNGIVYIMGRMTPTQQSHLIDIANDTAGITELVLLTTLVNDRGATIGTEDVMSDSNLAAADAAALAPVQPVIRQNVATSSNDNATQAGEVESNPSTGEGSSSSYIDLYKDQ